MRSQRLHALSAPSRRAPSSDPDLSRTRTTLLCPPHEPSRARTATRSLPATAIRPCPWPGRATHGGGAVTRSPALLRPAEEEKTPSHPAAGRSVGGRAGGEVDQGAADGAARGGLDPGHAAGPVEAVRAGQVHQHVPHPELLQAHRALRRRRRLAPPQQAPAEPAPPGRTPHVRRLREHLPLQHPRRRWRRASLGCRRRRRSGRVLEIAAAARARCVWVWLRRRGSHRARALMPTASFRYQRFRVHSSGIID